MVTFDDAVFKARVEGVEEAKKKMTDMAQTWANSVSGMEKAGVRGTAGITANFAKLDEMMKDSVSTMNMAATGFDTLESSADKTNRQIGFLRGGFVNMITTGMFMSIGWQAINGVLTTVTEGVKDLIFANVDLEASMRAIETVSISTGRNYAEVQKMMAASTDQFMTKAALAPGVLRLLSTELSTDQIKNFIQAVKDGSAAMGYQAEEQLPLVARGFKQLSANILDNIGVTVYLNKVRRQASEELGIHQDALTEAQIHQELYNEIIRQTEKYTGLYQQQLETAKGSIIGIGTAWNQLSQTVSQTEPIKQAADAITRLIQSIDIATWQSQQLGPIQQKAIANIGATLDEKYLGFFDKQREEQKASKDATAKYYDDMRAKMKEWGIDTTDMLQAQIEYRKLSETEMLNQKQAEEDLRRIGLENNDVIRAQKDAIADVSTELTTEQKLLSDKLTLVDDLNLKIAEQGFALKDYRVELSSVNEELSYWTKQQSTIVGVINDINNQLERKKKLLYPEQYVQTEQQYAEAQQETTQAIREQEQAQEQLYKRVEPVLYKKYLDEEKVAREQVTQATLKETDLKSKLMDEVSALEQRLTQENAAYAEASSYVEELTQRKEDLNTQIENGNALMDTWSEQLYYANRDIPKLRDKVDELTGSLDTMNKSMEATVNLMMKLPMESQGTLIKQPQTLTNVANTWAQQKGVSIAPEQMSLTDWQEALKVNVVSGKPTWMPTLQDLLGIKTTMPLKSYQAGTKYVPETGVYKLHRGEEVVPTNRVEIPNSNIDIDKIIDSFARGTSYVPTTGLYRLHEGEQVIPAKDDKMFMKTLSKKFTESLGSFETGTNYVPETGMYKLHQGEKVLSANTSNVTNQNSNIVLQQGAIVINAQGMNANEIYREFQRQFNSEILRRHAA